MAADVSNIKKELNRIKESESQKLSNSSDLVVMSALKKCYYAEHKPKQEAKMVYAIQLKNGEALERIGLHASAMVKEKDFCYRQQVLSLFFKMSQGEELSLKSKCIFEEGNAIHEKWQRLFIRGGLGTYKDMDSTQLKPEYDLSFTPDAILTISGKKYICEIKSMNTFAFQKSKGHPSGRKQCMLYEYLTGIHNGFVLMEDKNTQDFKIEMVPYDFSEISTAVEHLEAIQEYKHNFITTKKPPKRCELCKTYNSKRAKECQMRDACWNQGMGRIKLK